MKIAYEIYSIKPQLYIKVLKDAEEYRYETTGRTNITKAVLIAVIDDLDINDGKKAQLWQFITEEDVLMNPYSVEHAQLVHDYLAAML